MFKTQKSFIEKVIYETVWLNDELRHTVQLKISIINEFIDLTVHLSTLFISTTILGTLFISATILHTLISFVKIYMIKTVYFRENHS